MTRSSIRSGRRSGSALRRTLTTVAVVVAGAVVLAACGANSTDGGTGSGGTKSIALLLPESKTTRYETFDKPLFEDHVAKLCDSCEVAYYNADQDEAKQTQQMDEAINAGASVIVLDPVNGAGATGMVQSAQDAGIPVIAYDRFIENADYYMSFDNETVGKLQAQGLLAAMGGKGDILMLNGAPSDPNAAQFKAGATKVFQTSPVKILASYDNPDWSPENAQKWTTDQLGTYDPAQLDGVYAANDGQAGGVIAALTGAGVSENSLPPVTGQDAELAAIQRIIAGQQALTIYKPIPIEAQTAAEVAVKLANGEDIGAKSDTGISQSQYQGVPSFIFTPIVVTKDNVADTVVADGFYSVADICAGEYAAACQAAGIS